MSAKEGGVDDPIASALVGGTVYERLRVERYQLFRQSIPVKLAAQGAILAGLALVIPLAMTLPSSTRALFPGGDPLTASPKILLLGAYAGAIELVAAAALCYVGYRRLRGGEIGEAEARHLLNVEDVASMVSLVTGGAAVLAVDAFFLLGHGGADAVAELLAAGGSNPFAGTPVPVTVVGVGLAAASLAVALFVGSYYFSRQLSA
ncbi:hypothetical protein JCM30237_00680 [Halolamina litorea]|uniref:Uncharacterized protein n=1 Tax=Halolamina litorea TaxID=1515593 RepID=A0ABD6BRS8_9EURY|nr:hypothetical protein [Halolamina litorea]